MSETADPAVSTAAVEILAYLNLAAEQARSSPADRASALRLAAPAHQSITAFLEDRSPLTLLRTSDGLRVNGCRLEGRDLASRALESAVTDRLAEAAITRVSFERGVELDEVLAFVTRLARGRPEAGAGPDDAGHVRVNAPSEPAPAPPPPVRAAEKSGALAWSEAWAAMKDLTDALSQSRPELQAGLRRVGETLVRAFPAGSREAALLRKTLEGLPETPTPGVIPCRAVARAERLLELSPEERAEVLPREAPALAAELCALDRPDLAARLVAGVSGLLEGPSAPARAGARALLALRDVLDRHPLSTVREGLEALARGALEEPGDPETYEALSELAAGLAEARLARREFQPALETLSLWRRHARLRDGTPGDRPLAARAALRRLATPETLAALAARTAEGDAVAARTLEAFDEAATAFLVAELQRVDDPEGRRRLAEVLFHIGPAAGSALAESLLRTPAVTDALRLLEALPHAAPENVVLAALDGLLVHPLPTVRRQVARTLAQRSYPGSGRLLVEALRNQNEPALRVALIEGLGRIRYSRAVPLLKGLAESKEEPEEVRAAACLALGTIGDGKALPILARLATRGLLRSIGRTIRLAAIRALKPFARHPDGREALMRAALDPDPALQGEAVAMLEGPAAPDETRPETLKLAGSLGEIPIDQICQLLESTAKTGILRVDFEGCAAEVCFEEGQVVAADFDGRQDQEAFNSFVRRDRGTFTFEPGDVAARRRVRIPVRSVLLEAFRLADEGDTPPR
jgi:hypothetical protein